MDKLTAAAATSSFCFVCHIEQGSLPLSPLCPCASVGLCADGQPGGEVHDDLEDIRPHALIISLYQGYRRAPLRRPQPELRRDMTISLPRSSPHPPTGPHQGTWRDGTRWILLAARNKEFHAKFCTCT